MRRAWLLGLAIVLLAPVGAWAVFLLAPSAESLTIECRSDGLYFGFQIDDTPMCSDLGCMWIKARTDGGDWIKYGAHKGSHNGRVRSMMDLAHFRKAGALGEALLDRMLTAQSVEFQHPVTGTAVAFPISENDQVELAGVASKCGEAE